MNVCSVESDSANPLAIARQAPVSMEFSRQEYWSGCHFPLKIFRMQGSNQSFASPALAGEFLPPRCHLRIPKRNSTTLLFNYCWYFAAAAKSLQSCPTLWDPHRQQPTRLPRPWDSPSKNTGVGCHFLLQCM